MLKTSEPISVKPEIKENRFEVKSIISGAVWGIISKIIAAFVNFGTVPLLIAFYGKANYGLITLAFSLNAYLRLMELGIGVGSIRYFSLWKSNSENEKIVKLSQSSVVFYTIIGVFNVVALLFISEYSHLFFTLSEDQVFIFKWMLYILSASTIINWPSNVINQLLTSNGDIAWLNRISLIGNLLNVLSVYIAISFQLSLQIYFLLYIISTLIQIPFNLVRLKRIRIPIIKLFTPIWHSRDFKEVFKYSISIFIMGVFQFSADYLRPLILAAFYRNGTSILTDFRVLQTFGLLITMIGGVFINTLLPYSTKLFINNDEKKINDLLYKGTRYISIFLSLVIFCLVCNSKLLLKLYLGPQFQYLSTWLNLWLITLLYMHNAPVSSMILSTGKTKFLVYLAASSSLICLILTYSLVNFYAVGAAVIGYMSFIFLHLSGDYFYNIPKILKLNSKKIFLSFLPSAIIGFICWITVYILNNLWITEVTSVQILINSILFIILYIILIAYFVLRKDELKSILSKYF